MLRRQCGMLHTGSFCVCKGDREGPGDRFPRETVTQKEDFCTAELMETGKTAGSLRTRQSGLEHKKDVRAFSGHGEIVLPEKFYGTLKVRDGQSVRTPLSIMVYIHKADGKKRC